MKIKTCLLLSLSLVAACKQNPYPNTGELKQTEPPRKEEVKAPIGIAMADVLEFKEGRLGEYAVRVSVKAPGIPLVAIDNLPAGAVYDKENFILRWRPDFLDGNDSKDPTIRQRIYPITIWLRNSLDPVSSESKVVNLLVSDVPRPINILSLENALLTEGEKWSTTFTVENADYPQGPFQVIAQGMPAGLEVSQVNPTTFKLQYAPDYYQVNQQTDGSSKAYSGKILVVNPSNYTAEKAVRLTINDKRLGSNLVVPDTLTQGLDVNFQAAAYDLNKEVIPKLTLISPLPKGGNFSFKEVKNAESHSTVLNLSWTDVPASYNGQEFSFRFKSCVLNDLSMYVNCRESSTKVKIAVREHLPPQISRASWPLGEIVYLGHDQSLMRAIAVKNGETSPTPPRVEIFPIEMRKYVKWEKDQLSVHFTEAGTFQFNLTATSDFNLSTTESFLVEVFPKERSGVLFFADSTRDPEVLFYKSTLKEVDIMNPSIQEISARDVSARETLIIGTSALMDREAGPKILRAIDKIKNIVVASPLIDQLPEKFLEKLKYEYDLVPLGRLNDLPQLPPLEKLFFVKNGQFSSPVNPVSLKRNTSVESINPMFFNGGLYDSQKICKGVLGLSPDGLNPYVIGVVCARANGSRVTLLGTEWADLKVSAADAGIPLSWFNTMLRTKF